MNDPTPLFDLEPARPVAGHLFEPGSTVPASTARCPSCGGPVRPSVLAAFGRCGTCVAHRHRPGTLFDSTAIDHHQEARP